MIQRIETQDGDGNVIEVREIEVPDVPDPLADVRAAVEEATTFDALKAATVAYLYLLTGA